MKKALLVILDGFGMRKDDDFNAVAGANKPNLSNYIKSYAFGKIEASEQAVGLPKGQFGNSEVGHLNLGAGRVVRQDITKIDYEIETGDFYKNEALNSALAKSTSGTVHILGLLSDGGVHSHQNHIYELIKLASQADNIQHINLHMFLDGRDTPPQSALAFIRQLEDVIKSYPKAKIVSIAGRYYAMDRDKRWDRLELAYKALVNADADTSFATPSAAISAAYAEQITDEFVKPAIFNNYSGIKSGDSMIFANFRSDRAVQLTDAFIGKDFNGFPHHDLGLAAFVTMTRYNDKLDCLVAYPPTAITNTLGEYISNLGLKQLRIAETEKYPHITYFFNGGEQQPFANETRILINSPKEVATYDLKPEMSLPEVANKLVDAINSNEYDLIITNFANGDMVGHTGNYNASIKAVEALDLYLGKVVEAMKAQGGEVLIVADHGNCEEMFDYKSNQPHTQHTTNLVPCIYIGREASIREGGALKDVAPSLLAMMGLTQPLDMTGQNLILFK
ncbi:MAG: 2,3-bisphosphoglycerate-independent phosphoglycerate mutase [Burkholderiales bacterium]|nr:2,3-bisphosphoglycerate-independent phosphoglycerate mutase [Burkholderiales bacterium]